MPDRKDWVRVTQPITYIAPKSKCVGCGATAPMVPQEMIILDGQWVSGQCNQPPGWARQWFTEVLTESPRQVKEWHEDYCPAHPGLAKERVDQFMAKMAAKRKGKT